MTSRLDAAAFDAQDPARLALFWGRLLGRAVAADGDAARLPGGSAQLGLRFVPVRAEVPGPGRAHLHLTSTDPADQADRVAAAVGLGAEPLDLGQRPEEGHVVLADPEGNAFCVIEPGNLYLAGCGLLGELACDGTRDVGLFWSRVLGWPLVWDRDQETAVQSPDGGTKVSWGGEPVPADGVRHRNRHHLDLVCPADGHAAEAARLESLGAARQAVTDDGTLLLTDPDGNGFRLTPT